ncbi:MAG: hypothetical protein IT204_16760 [Fimbriimonadaceae bacterium]|nr:hypothetical protein [Fimbriimonadaceae bacterium]
MALRLGDLRCRLGYNKGTNRHKHVGHQPCAEVVTEGVVVIGKCPAGMTLGRARELINAGMAFYESDDEDAWPRCLVCIDDADGVVYLAVPTEADDYHGYPILRRDLDRKGIALSIVVERADKLGCRRASKRWLEQRSRQ